MQGVSKPGKTVNLLQALSAPLRGLWEMACAPARHNERMRRIEYLHGLSDAQLARRGLTRDDIVRHVYGRRGRR